MKSKQITQSIIQYKSFIIPEFKKIHKNRFARIAFPAVFCAIILSLVFCTVSKAEVYKLEISGKSIGYLTDQSFVKKAIGEITEDYSGGKDSIQFSVDESAVSIKPTDLKKDSIKALTMKGLKKKIIASDICKANGWAININGKNIAAVTSEKAANGILEDIKNHYLASGSNVISATFKENVIVTQSAVGIDDFVKPEEAETLLLTGEKATETYAVKEGDTLWDIAAACGMSITELQNANPGFDPNKLQIGQQLNLAAVKPYITVETKELITAVEPIEFQKVYEETNSLYKGEIKVKTPGVCGSKQVSSEVSKENGVTITANIITSVTLSEPQSEVALKGTKSSAGSVGRGGGRSISVDASGSEVVAYAKQFLGTPYVHGGSSPNGFDCSGFTSYVYSHFGASLPRTASGQYSCGDYVERSSLEPGDLIFFTSSSKSSRISHVAIYVGGGKFIHSPQQGESVEIRSLSSTNLHYCGAVRAN